MTKTDNKLENLVNQAYKYGFSTSIETESLPPGLSEEVITLISKKKNEPTFMLEFRLRAYKKWKKMSCPDWAQLSKPNLDYQSIVYYSAPKMKKVFEKMEDVDPEL